MATTCEDWMRAAQFGLTPIDQLRQQRKATVVTTPPKPKPVTDEQLLAVVEQLADSFDALREFAKDISQRADETNNRLSRFHEAGWFTRLFGWSWWWAE